MKTRLTILKHLIVLCCVFATTAVFGQTIRTWTGGGDGVSVGSAANWGGTLPANGEIGQWDGIVAGNLTLTYNGGIGGNFGQPGASFSLTANQTDSVTVISPVSASANLGVFHLTNSSPAGALTFGDGTANVLNLIWRASPADPPYDPHYLLNNSAGPVTIHPNVRWQAGGGNTHILVFGGSGNWVITNSLTTANGVGTTIRKEGSGTLAWSGPSIGAALGNSTINTPVDIQGGALVLRSSGVLGSQRITNNGVRLEFDAPAHSQTLSGPIHGAGLLKVGAGTLTLSSGQSDFTGDVEIAGTGTLVVGGGENVGVSGPLGVGGTISFTGGTLQFSVNNTFDYSARFNTAANQAYSFHSGGQNVTFATGLSSSGGTLTKNGPGTVTLSGANTYNGATTISGGKLVFQGTKSGSGNITVANGTTLGVTATGTQVTPTALTLGTTAGVGLEFNNVNSTTTAPLAAETLSTGGTITINVNSGTFTAGQSYPLLTWTSGSAPTVTLGALGGALGSLSVSGNTVFLNVSAIAFVWTGGTDGNWDTSTAGNWIFAGSPAVFANGGHTLFDDSAPGTGDVILNAAISQASVTVNNGTKAYSITSSGGNNIGGSGSITKLGTGTISLAGGVNTYNGVTTFASGTLSVGALADGGSASDIGAASSSADNLVLNGGRLQYTGGVATSDHLFTLGLGGGVIEASGFGALNLNNAGSIGLSGFGARVLTLAGSGADDNTLAATLSDSGGSTSLAKSGAGKWVLTGNNTHSGGTTVAAGTLQVGGGGASGALGSGNVIVNGSLGFNRTGTLTNGVISGTGSVTVDGGGTVVLPGDNTYDGATTIINGILQIGVGGATGKLNGGAPVVNDGTIIYDSTDDFTMGGFNVLISGTGNLIKRGSGLLKIIGNNTYSGWTLIEAGATLQVTEGNQGQFASSVVTNHGTLRMTRQDDGVFIYGGNIVGSGSLVKDNNNQNFGNVTLTGENTYTGGTIIGGGSVIVGDGGVSGSIAGDVVFAASTSPFNENNRQIIFNRADDVTFPGLIGGGVDLPLGTRGQLVQNGAGTLTLTGDNTYFGGTIINAGILQVGNGGTSGAIGTGPATVNSLLVFNRSDDVTFGGGFTGSGSVVKDGAGKLTLTATNNIFGSLIVSNGTLIVNSEDFSSSVNVIAGTLGGTGAFYGSVILEAGTTLAPGTSVGTLTFNGFLSIGGNVAVEVDKSLSPSNDVAMVNGGVEKTGTGTLTVANLGPTLAPGDKFTLFSQPVANGAALTVTGGGAGVTWTNSLDTDGSITVLTAPAAPPTLNFTQTGNNLQFNWSDSGYKLQAQTNSLNVGISNNWSDYPGGGSSPINVPVDATNGSVFFRLAPTP